MFYLLKSGWDRHEVGDVIIDLDDIESLSFTQRKFKDTENVKFGIIVHMKSRNDYRAWFSTIEEARKCVKQLIGTKIPHNEIEDFSPQEDK